MKEKVYAALSFSTGEMSNATDYLPLWIWLGNFYKLTSSKMCLALVRGKRLQFVYPRGEFSQLFAQFFSVSRLLETAMAAVDFIRTGNGIVSLRPLLSCHCGTRAHPLACSFLSSPARVSLSVRVPLSNTRVYGARGPTGNGGPTGFLRVPFRMYVPYFFQKDEGGGGDTSTLVQGLHILRLCVHSRYIGDVNH